MSGTSGLSSYVQSATRLLDAGNYNEMDALVLAALSYIEFEKVYSDYGEKSVSVQQFAKDVLASDISLSDSQRTLLEQVQNSDRYSNCTIHGMAAENESSQWAAMTVDVNDGSNTSVIAMRGTNGTVLGWNEDFQLAYEEEGTEAQKLSADYLQNSTAENIFLTGHSKGGNNVTSAYVMSDAAVRRRVVHIDNFDGPGTNDEFREQFPEGYAELENKLDNYYPQNSVVGLLLNDNPGQQHFVDCESSEQYGEWGILGEHDPYAWQLNGEGSGLKSGEQSELSDILNQTLDTTLGELSQQERRDMVAVIIGMQVTALIAGKDTLYGQSADNVEILLQQLYESHQLFGWEKDLYGGILGTVAQVAAAFQLYSQLTDRQKQTVKKTLALLITNGVCIYIKSEVEDALDWLADQYRFVAGVIRRKQAELAALILNFAETIHEQIGTWCEQVLNFLFRNKQYLLQGTTGPTAFEVDFQAMAVLAEELQAQQRALQLCGQQVRQISRSLLGQMSIGASWQIGRIAGNLENEARICGQMANGLYCAQKQYVSTETQVVAMAGL